MSDAPSAQATADGSTALEPVTPADSTPGEYRELPDPPFGTWWRQIGPYCDAEGGELESNVEEEPSVLF